MRQLQQQPPCQCSHHRQWQLFLQFPKSYNGRLLCRRGTIEVPDERDITSKIMPLAYQRWNKWISISNLPNIVNPRQVPTYFIWKPAIKNRKQHSIYQWTRFRSPHFSDVVYLFLFLLFFLMLFISPLQNRMLLHSPWCCTPCSDNKGSIF